MIYRDPEPHRGLVATVIAGCVALFGLVGAMDYADEQREADTYCEMVALGAWPDRPELECEQ